MKRLRSALAMLAAALLVGPGCDRLAGGSRNKFSGTLEMTEHALGARVAGRVAQIAVDEGDTVEPGQLLATLDRHDQTQKDFDRVSALFKQGGTTEQAIEQAALALGDQTIVSPVDGVVLVKVHDAGEGVAAGSPVVIVGDRRRLWVRVYVPEGQISRVRQRQRATLRVDGVPQAFRGHVGFIATNAEFTPRNVQTPEERVTQVFAVKVVLDDPEPSLRPGVSADVTLEE